jgi:hypothetical protein
MLVPAMDRASNLARNGTQSLARGVYFEQLVVDLPRVLEDVMEHRTRGEIRGVANVLPSCLQARPLSKRERLEFWVDALEREGGRHLRTLFEIEYAPAAKRAGMRADDSPISVAYSDPRLRAEGLAGDTVGDATAFFGISEMELHNILCFCHSGETMSAEMAAARVRAAATREAGYRPVYGSRIFAGGLSAGLTAIGVLTV